MSGRVRIDGKEYEVEQLNEELKKIVTELAFVQSKLNELENKMALLSRAKNGYISDLKSEIVQLRTGVDFDDLFE